MLARHEIRHRDYMCAIDYQGAQVPEQHNTVAISEESSIAPFQALLRKDALVLTLCDAVYWQQLTPEPSVYWAVDRPNLFPPKPGVRVYT